jgi:hypothetical protein
MKMKVYDDHMRNFQVIDQIHVRPGDGWRGRDRSRIKRRGWEDQKRGFQTIDQVHVLPEDRRREKG